MDTDLSTVEMLKEKFFGKISYKFVESPQKCSFSEEDEIVPIPISYFVQTSKEKVAPKADFELTVWLLNRYDLYLEASYLWYTKLREDGGFNFNNLREFFWCVISANSHTNVVIFTEKLLNNLKS